MSGFDDLEAYKEWCDSLAEWANKEDEGWRRNM